MLLRYKHVQLAFKTWRDCEREHFSLKNFPVEALKDIKMSSIFGCFRYDLIHFQ